MTKEKEKEICTTSYKLNFLYILKLRPFILRLTSSFVPMNSLAHFPFNEVVATLEKEKESALGVPCKLLLQDVVAKLNIRLLNFVAQKVRKD